MTDKRRGTSWSWPVWCGASWLGALVSAAIAAVGLQVELTLRFMLLSLLLLVICCWRLPRLLDGAITGLTLGAAFLAAGDAYQDVWWLDDVAHLIVTSVLAVGATIAHRNRLSRRKLESLILQPNMIACSATALTLGLSFASAWELYEWWVVTTINPGTVVTSYRDTMLDMALGGGGALLGGVVLGWDQGRQRGRQQQPRSSPKVFARESSASMYSRDVP